MQDKYHELTVPTRVIFQAGGLALAGAECRKIEMSRPYVITDKVIRRLGLVDKLALALETDDVTIAGIFDDVPIDSDLETVKKATEEMARTAADGILAIGGGSVIDTAKAVNILLVKGGDLVDHQGVGVLDDAPFVPFLCIPTTAGTGSEVSMAAAIRDPANKQKLFFLTPHLAARTAILDPELTVSMPPNVTATTGFDALTHAVESVFATNAQPATDGLAVMAIRRIVQHLPRAMKDASDLESRGEMLMAANIAGIAFSNSCVGIVHACAHALGAVKGTPHGLANALMLPHGMRYNLDHIGDRKDLLTWAFGSDDVAGAAEKLAADCGLPSKLRDADIKEEDLDALASYAESEPSLLFNPREAEKPQLLELFRKAY